MTLHNFIFNQFKFWKQFILIKYSKSVNTVFAIIFEQLGDYFLSILSIFKPLIDYNFPTKGPKTPMSLEIRKLIIKKAINEEQFQKEQEIWIDLNPLCEQL